MALSDTQRKLEEDFARAAGLSDNLEDRLRQFCGQREHMDGEIDEANAALKAARDKLISLDSLSGEDSDLARRLHGVRALQQDLRSLDHRLDTLQMSVQSLGGQFHTSETAALGKDVVTLRKNLDSQNQKTNKVEAQLAATLERRATDALDEIRVWLKTAHDRLAWCHDVSGDRYSVDAKLAVTRDLLGQLEQGEEKLREAENKVDIVKPLASNQKSQDLEQSCQRAANDWQLFVEELHSTKCELETALSRWQGFSQNYDSFAQWLKESETKLRHENIARPDLDSKRHMLDTLKVCTVLSYYSLLCLFFIILLREMAFLSFFYCIVCIHRR
jgi:hypothetical protein